MFLVAGYARAPGPPRSGPRTNRPTTFGARYIATPALLLLAAVFIQVDAEIRSAARSTPR